MTEIIKTEDGSTTILSKKFGVHYHSTFGAIQESQHIFLNAGFKYLSEKGKNVSILEVGFGTGLNALLTILESEKSAIKVDYVGIEAYPLAKETVDKLNYHDLLESSDSKKYLNDLHRINEMENDKLNGNFRFKLIIDKLESINLGSSIFDIIYFDAFDPEVQPELWTEEVFAKLYMSMINGGVLVTYSCKGIVKRALKAAGFRIEKLPGPKGKREILRASKN